MLKQIKYLLLALTITIANATEITTCPKIEALIKKDGVWSTDSNWQSFNPSFIVTINKFVSAQWQGEHVGKVLCTYIGASNKTFPVSLQSPFLAKTPTNKNWQRQKQGHYNCYGPDVNNCPIEKIIEKEEKIESQEDLVNFLKSIKNK
jgi:hypothetical protein